MQTVTKTQKRDGKQAGRDRYGWDFAYGFNAERTVFDGDGDKDVEMVTYGLTVEVSGVGESRRPNDLVYEFVNQHLRDKNLNRTLVCESADLRTIANVVFFRLLPLLRQAGFDLESIKIGEGRSSVTCRFSGASGGRK